MIRLLRLDPARDEGWEDLRQVRNQCAEFMTGDRTYISRERQAEYRRRLPPSSQVYVVYEGDVGVAFMYLRLRGDAWVPTYGVIGRKRGMGLGQLLVALSQAIASRLELEVRRDNAAAIGLYLKMGFVFTAESDTTISMLWFRRRR